MTNHASQFATIPLWVGPGGVALVTMLLLLKVAGVLVDAEEVEELETETLPQAPL